jgi:hypothetical protein
MVAFEAGNCNEAGVQNAGHPSGPVIVNPMNERLR